MYLGGKRPDGTPRRGFLTPLENAKMNESGKFVCSETGTRLNRRNTHKGCDDENMDPIAIVGFDPYKNAWADHV